MTIHEMAIAVTSFVEIHQQWVIPLTFLFSFVESLAFLSLLAPATTLLLAIGVLIGETNIPFLPVWLSAVAGAFLGDWVSYIIGYYYKDSVDNVWPFKERPELLAKGHAFFAKWGVAGVFIGRFFGPIRAVIPLVAGICAMPKFHFQMTNIASAIVWASAMLFPGAFGFPLLFHW